MGGIVIIRYFYFQSIWIYSGTQEIMLKLIQVFRFGDRMEFIENLTYPSCIKQWPEEELQLVTIVWVQGLERSVHSQQVLQLSILWIVPTSKEPEDNG